MFNDLLESIKSLPTNVLKEMEANMEQEQSKYTIIYKEAENKYEMNGVLADFIAEHFYTIANENGIKCTGVVPVFHSESHLLAILQYAGIEINLLEEDGSRMVW